MAGGFKEFVKATLSSLGKGDLATDANVSALESKYAGDYRTFLTKAYEANGMDPKTLTDDVFGKIAEKYGLGTTAVSSVDPAVALPRPSDEGAAMPNPNTLAKDAVNAALITAKYPLAPAPKYTAQERSILDPIAIKYFGTTAEGLAKTAPRLDENRLRTVTEELELMNADWDEKVRNNTATPEEQKDYQAKNRALVKEYDGLVFGYQREVDAFNKKIKNFTEEVDIATGEKFPDGYKTLEDASSDAEQVLADIGNNKKLAKKEDYSVSYKGKELEEKLPLLPDRQNFSTKDNALAEQIIIGVKNSIENVKSAKGGTIVGNFTEAAVKDFAKYFGDYITLGQTLKDNRQITALNEKTKRIAEGSDEVFTPGEASLIKALQVADKTAKQIDKDLPEAYRWGSIIGNSAGFMLEFAAFGGGAASLAKKGMIKMAAQAGRQGVMSAGKKASLNVGIKLATAGVKTPFQPTLLKNFAINKSNGETNGSALGNAYYDTFKDVFTEGMYENLAIKGIANPNMIQRLLAKTGNAAVGAKGIKGFLISTGQETLEEKTAEIMEGIKDVYQDKRTLSEVNKQFWDPMSNLRTVGTVGLMSGFFMGTDVVSRAYNGHKLTSAHKFNGTKLSADLRSAIDDALANKDLSIGQIQNIALNTAVQHAASLQTKEEKAQLITDAVNYAVSGITLEAFNQSSRSKAGVTYDTAQIGEQEFSVIVGDNAMIVNELFTSEEEANNVALELLKKSTAPEGTFQANVKSVDGGFEVSITPTEKKGSRAVLDKLNSEISYQETDAEETGAVREGGLEEERDQVGVGDLPSVDQQKEEVVTPKTETGEKGQKDGGGKAKEKRLLVEGQQIVNEPTVVRDVMNRPATLTKFGETEMEPVQGNVYQDGQQVVFETHDGKVYELGNVDEISDTNLSEMGLVPEVVSLKVNPDGTFEYNGEILVPAAEHAPSSIRYGKNGAVTRVDMRTPDGSITRSLRGQDAVEAAYTILLDRPNLDQELETVTVSADGNTADVAGEEIDLTENLNIQDATGGVQQVTEIQANPNPKKVGRERIREQVIASSKRLTEEQVDQQMAVLDAMFQAMRPDLSLDEAYDTYIGEVTSDITKFGGQISQGDQGAIMWKAGKAVIGIFKTANASTLLHEAGGHLGRVILAQKAANDSAFKKHYDNAAKWSGAKQNADGSYEWTVEAEEKFARSFEKYVRDGVLPENAPSGLKKAFDALADMLRRVYVALRDINFNLSPEIREVFDAMLVGKGQTSVPTTPATGPSTVNKQIHNKKQLRHVLESGNFAMVTGENPDNVKQTDAVNKKLNAKAHKWLVGKDYVPIPITGHYSGNVENSFFVRDMKPNDVADFLDKFKQQSSATHDKFLFRNGTYHERTGHSIDGKYEDDYSTMSLQGKPVDFAVDYDFSVLKQEEGSKKLKTNDARLTQDFFSKVAKGEAEEYKPTTEWKPVLDFTPKEQQFKRIYDDYEGNFDMHIATSIPTFRETQVKTGRAVTDIYKGKNAIVYDLGGSEGGWVKAITRASGGKIKSFNLDPNPDMEKIHNDSPVKGSEFVKEAFLEGWTEDDGTVVRAHNPKVKADVVHESMMFQFVTPEREQFVEEAKRYLKPNGIFVTEEKFQLPNREEYLANEAKKAKYKDLYFTKEQQEKKSDTVLVGMAKDQALVTDYEKLLTKNFAHVAQYWDSGNFKGYVASDSKSAVDTFLKEVGDTSSQFSTPGVLKQKPAQEKKTILSDLDRAHLSNMKSNNVEDRVVAGDNVSVRTPAGKDAPSDVHSSANYGMSMDAYREAPAAYLKNAILASTYPIVSKIVTENDLRILNAGVAATKKGGDKAVLEEAMRKADVIYEHMINNVVDNLLWLHDGMDADLRDVAHRWYDGANVIAQGMAKKYGLTTEQAAAILAIHSPQKDWFRNISLADRTMMIITTKGDFVITQAMVDKYIYLQANATKQDKETPEALAARRERLRLEAIAQTKGLVGKKLKEADNVGLFGQMVRAYDEVYNSRDYDIYSPNGDKMGLAKTDKGKIAKAGWGPYAEIDKAYSIFKDGSIDNISMQLGDEHKVRNFFNNINDPNSVDGYTTIDTHAVAAGLYLPLSGNSKEVGHNFNKASGSISNGISGLYPVYYEAYNRAADARGVLPRQMQSITWEAVRGLFEKADKQDKSAAGIEARVRSVWNDYANNKITIYDARKRIDEIAKGVSVPSWARYDSTELGQKGKAANAGQLQGGAILGDGGAGRAGNGGFDSGVDEVSTVLKQEASRGFTEREKPDPKKTVTAYKLFRIDPKRPGQLFPLFVDAKSPVPVGPWLDAGIGEGYSFMASNGHWYIPATTGVDIAIPDEATRQELLDRGVIKSASTKSVKAVARRPGWHAGDVPIATHIGGKTPGSKKVDYRPNDQVWAEVKMGADVNWQPEANRRGVNAKGNLVVGDAHITDAIPEDGVYRYKTNPNMTGNWIIGGTMKVTRVLTDEEVRAINVANGVEDLPRTQPMDLGKAGFGPTVDGVAPVLKQSTIDVDGKQRPVLNSNGRQIHATEEGIRNFWRWFGDSKVVDEQGRPLVVYHGARVEDGYGDMFDVFSGLEAIGWFAENKQVAENYNLIGWMYSVYLSIRKPFVLKGDMNDEITASEFEERAGFELTRNYYTRGRGYSPSDRLEMWMYVQDNTTSFQTQLLDNGYDGIYVLEKNEPTWAVIKNPSQIKSASGNLGSFSPAEGSVLKQRSTPIENNTVTIDRHRKTGKVTEEATAEEKEAMSAIILKVGETLSKAKKQVDRITDSILYASTFGNITTFEDFQKKIIADLAKKNVPATLKDAVASLIQSELAAKGASGKPLIGNDQLKKSRMTSLLSDIKYAKTVRSTLLSMQKAIQLLNEMQQERQMQGLRGLVAKISKNLKGKKDKYSVLANDVKRFSEIDPELIINSGDPKMIHDYFMTLSSLTRPEADVFGTPAEFHQLVQDLVALTKLEDIENMAETLNAGTQDRALKVADLMKAFGISSKLAEKYIDKAASQPTYRSATVAHLESMTADEIADEYGMTIMVNGVEVPDVDRAQELLDRIRDAKNSIRSSQAKIAQTSVEARQTATANLDAVQDMTLGQLERLAKTFDKFSRGIPMNFLHEFVKRQLAKENAGFVSNMFLDALRDNPLKMARKIFSMIQPKWYDRLRGRHLDTWGEKIALTGKTSSYIDWKDPARVFDANVWYKLETAIGKAQGDVKRLSDKYNKALMALYHKLNPEQRKKVNYWYTFYRKQLELNGLGETGIEEYFKQSFDAYNAFDDTKASADRLTEVWADLNPYKITNPDGTISLDTDAMEKDMSPELRAVHEVIKEGMVELEGMSAFVQNVVRGGSLNNIPGYFPQRYNGTSDAQDVDDYLKKGFGVGSRASSTYERTKNKAIDFNAFGVYDRHINDVIRDFYLTPVIKEMKMFFEELRASIKTEGLTGRELLAAEKALQIINTLERTFLNTNEGDAGNRSVLLHYLRGFASRPDTFTSKLFHDTLRRYAESLISHFTKTIGETISNIPMGLQYMDEIAIGKRISNAPIPRGLTSAEIDELKLRRSGISLAEYVGSNAVNALSRFSDDMLSSEKNYAKAFNDRYDRYDTVLDFLEHNKLGDEVVRPMNNFLISTGDRIFVHPAWNGAFEKRFKEITGSYVDREAFDTDPEYRVKYDSALRAAGQAADRVRARISNPTSKIGASLSDATGRYGWHWYARMFNKLFYGFGSRESNTLRANLDVIMSGKPNVAEKKQALREIVNLYARNLLYQEIMAALYILFAGSDDDRDAWVDKFLSVEYHARQFVAPLLTLGFGGLGNVAKIPIYYATEFVNKTLTEEFGHVYDPMNDSFVMAPTLLTPDARGIIATAIPGMGREIGKHYQYIAEDHDYTGEDYINVATMLGAMTRMVPTVKSFSLLANKAYNVFNPKPEVYAKEGKTAGEMLDVMRAGSKEEFDARKASALRRYVVAKYIQDREMVEYAKYFANRDNKQNDRLRMLDQIESRPADWDAFKHAMKINMNMSSGRRVEPYVLNVDISYDKSEGVKSHKIELIAEELLDAYVKYKKAK